MTSRMEFRNYESSAHLVHCNIQRKRYNHFPCSCDATAFVHSEHEESVMYVVSLLVDLGLCRLDYRSGTVNSNTVNSKFHYLEGNLTGA